MGTGPEILALIAFKRYIYRNIVYKLGGHSELGYEICSISHHTSKVELNQRKDQNDIQNSFSNLCSLCPDANHCNLPTKISVVNMFQDHIDFWTAFEDFKTLDDVDVVSNICHLLFTTNKTTVFFHIV